MRILVDIGYPTNVHFFKNIIWSLEKYGNEVKITLRNRDVAKYLLDAYGFKYETLVEEHYKGLFNKAIGMLKIDYKLYKIAKKFNPDILVGESPYIAHVGKLLRKPSMVFCNNESKYGAYFENMAFSRFADVICTSMSFEDNFDSKKHVKYNGYYFGACLHPNYFKPDPTVLDDLGLDEDEKFFILRFRSYEGSHDIGQRGFDFEKIEFIKELEKYGRVLVKSETKLSNDLRRYETPVVEKIHDALFFADVYIGDGFSMATEAAILGTPSILVSTIKRGYINELRDKYGLIFTCESDLEALRIVSNIQKEPSLKRKWREKREKMLSEKIDVLKFIVDFIEKYPESFYEFKSKQQKQ